MCFQGAESKCSEYVEAHETFEEDYANFLASLEKNVLELKKVKNGEGKLSSLGEKRKVVAGLRTSHAGAAAPLESLVDSGERLYAQTSPDGREILRQQIRTLRDSWESFGDDLEGTEQSLSLQASMLEDFSFSQDQLSKFLREVEAALEGSTQLKSNLPEKETQLRLHINSHQEILGKEELVRTVCERAQSLASATGDSSLAAYISNIQQLYTRIKSKSDGMRTKLETNVGGHRKLKDLSQEFTRWLSEGNLKLAQLSDALGEKGEIQKRLQEVESLTAQAEQVGVPLLAQLRSALPPVLSTTAPNGKPSLQADLAQLETAFKEYQDALVERAGTLTAAHAQWLAFDSDLATQTQWLKENELLFRSWPLCATLPEKERAVAQCASAREEIVAHEAVLNSFADQAHELCRVSGVERIKALVNQLNNRFQLLSVLSKETLNRAQLALGNHQSYTTMLDKVTAAVGGLEKNLKIPAIPLARNAAEKGECEKQLSGLTSLAEKLYPETEAGGRETVRADLRTLAERLEGIGEGLKGAEQKMAADSKLVNAFKENLEEVRNWLKNMERNVEEIKHDWTSAPDARAKALKLKLCQEDAQGKRAAVSDLEEKGNALRGKQIPGEFETDHLQAKYDGLMIEIGKKAGAQEKILEIMTEWEETVGKLEDFQRQIKEPLHLHSSKRIVNFFVFFF